MSLPCSGVYSGNKIEVIAAIADGDNLKR